MVVDCRSLIEFCRSFEQRRLSSDNHLAGAGQSRRRTASKLLNPLSHPSCEHSPFAAVDVVMLLLVLAALAVLAGPYFGLLFREASELLPAAACVLAEALHRAPVAYAAGLVLTSVSVFILVEFFCHQARKCGNPFCKGLRKAVEFDIQLETEDCVKCLPPVLEDLVGIQPLELGHDYKELEDELRKMAPLNGRTVLIFRATCGCPLGRMEVWGPRKARRIKK